MSKRMSSSTKAAQEALPDEPASVPRFGKRESGSGPRPRPRGLAVAARAPDKSRIEMELGELRRNPRHARKSSDETTTLREVVGSIEKRGLLQSIAVIASGDDGHTIIAGQRRHRATRLLRRETTPTAVLRGGSTYVLALIENSQRQGLKPFEEAEAPLPERKFHQQYSVARSSSINRILLVGGSESNLMETSS